MSTHCGICFGQGHREENCGSKPRVREKVMSEIKPAVREYNYHTWSKYMVKNQMVVPTGEHYGVLLFEKRREYSPSYEEHYNESYGRPGLESHEVDETTYFALPTHELLTTWLVEATQAKKKFIFFHVPKLGQATINVTIDVK